MEKIELIKQPQSLTALAYEKLRDAIYTGILKSGEIYTETGLAKQLGISKTPVREALLALSTIGFVTFLPRKGVTIKEFSENDIHEIFHFRKIIEVGAIEQVAKNAKSLDFEQVNIAFTNQKQAARKGEILSWLKSDRDFHSNIMQLTNNSRLVRTLQDLHQIIQMVCYETFQMNGRIDMDFSEHASIMKPMVEGRVQESKKAMAHHLDKAKQLVLSIGKLKKDVSESEQTQRGIQKLSL